ncbi:hypothetical protein GGR50DRAFT_692191 [Xylaria sp. CBS 124048]|nr:hypothetical protein GGR50DRAFT_692191 [Xylaria sp. CBS 124048]
MPRSPALSTRGSYRRSHKSTRETTRSDRHRKEKDTSSRRRHARINSVYVSWPSDEEREKDVQKAHKRSREAKLRESRVRKTPEDRVRKRPSRPRSPPSERPGRRGDDARESRASHKEHGKTPAQINSVYVSWESDEEREKDVKKARKRPLDTESNQNRLRKSSSQSLPSPEGRGSRAGHRDKDTKSAERVLRQQPLDMAHEGLLQNNSTLSLVRSSERESHSSRHQHSHHSSSTDIHSQIDRPKPHRASQLPLVWDSDSDTEWGDFLRQFTYPSLSMDFTYAEWSQWVSDVESMFSLFESSELLPGSIPVPYRITYTVTQHMKSSCKGLFAMHVFALSPREERRFLNDWAGFIQWTRALLFSGV